MRTVRWPSMTNSWPNLPMPLARRISSPLITDKHSPYCSPHTLFLETADPRVGIFILRKDQWDTIWMKPDNTIDLSSQIANNVYGKLNSRSSEYASQFGPTT